MKLKIVVFALLVLYACNTEEKSYEAFDRVKKAKESGKEIFIVSEDSAAVAITIKKPPNEWQKYKTETLQKIELAQAHITLLKKRKVKAQYKEKYNKQIAKLEEQNKKLKTKMDDYYNERESKWLEFKLDMEHQSNDIKTEINFLKQSKSSQGTYFEELFN